MAWNNLTAPQTSTSRAAQGQITRHDQAAVMAHAAARKQQIAKVLSAGGSPISAIAQPQGGYQDQIAGAFAAHGIPVQPGEIPAAIDGLTAQGHLTPQIGAALKAHNGPLPGPGGAATMRAIAGQVVANKQRQALNRAASAPQMPQMPQQPAPMQPPAQPQMQPQGGP